MIITDEQLREACDRLAFTPLGTIEAELPDDMQISDEAAADGECVENDRYLEFATSGEWVPEAGPLGFALGHPSPGWVWLRGLVDHIGVALEAERFDGADTEEVESFFREQAVVHAGALSWEEAFVAVADLGTVSSTTDTAEYIQSSMDTRTPFQQVAYDILAYAGFRVCRALFAAKGTSEPR